MTVTCGRRSNSSKYAIVRRRPSRSPTCGWHERVFRAADRLGRRRVGSSGGTGHRTIFDLEPVRDLPLAPALKPVQQLDHTLCEIAERYGAARREWVMMEMEYAGAATVCAH